MEKIVFLLAELTGAKFPFALTDQTGIL